MADTWQDLIERCAPPMVDNSLIPLLVMLDTMHMPIQPRRSASPHSCNSGID